LDEFKASVGQFSKDLRATPAVDSDRPVLVAGDPERAVKAKRSVEGIPIGPGLHRRLKEIAEESGARWHFREEMSRAG
jgi:LDH2 family malate/lactate/ureidoglycolate dehydrogenase